MCLTIDKELTEKMRSGPEKIKVYKFLKEGKYSPFKWYEWKVGENVAEGPIKYDYWGELAGGVFHVFLTREDTEDYLKKNFKKNHPYLICEFEAEIKNLVEAGYFTGKRSACFTKLTLLGEDQNVS